MSGKEVDPLEKLTGYPIKSKIPEAHSWQPFGRKEVFYQLASGKIIGEVEQMITGWWASANGKDLGNYISKDHAKKAVEEYVNYELISFAVNIKS